MKWWIKNIGPYVLALVVVVTSLGFARGCAGDPARLTYRQDSRTGLCFGYTWWMAITRVPCEKVRGHLEE